MSNHLPLPLGAYGKVFRGEIKLPNKAKFEDVAIKTIKRELYDLCEL